jgi:hypothetical protein
MVPIYAYFTDQDAEDEKRKHSFAYDIELNEIMAGSKDSEEVRI